MCIRDSLYTSTNTTLTRENADGFPSLIRFLASLGVRYIGCNSLIKTGRGRSHKDALEETELEAVLRESLEIANELKLEFNWFTPTSVSYTHLYPVRPYCHVSYACGTRFRS